MRVCNQGWFFKKWTEVLWGVKSELLNYLHATHYFRSSASTLEDSNWDCYWFLLLRVSVLPNQMPFLPVSFYRGSILVFPFLCSWAWVCRYPHSGVIDREEGKCYHAVIVSLWGWAEWPRAVSTFPCVDFWSSALLLCPWLAPSLYCVMKTSLLKTIVWILDPFDIGLKDDDVKSDVYAASNSLEKNELDVQTE